MRLFSTLDDGSGLTPAEHVMDAWIEEGIENSAEILQVTASPLFNQRNSFQLMFTQAVPERCLFWHWYFISGGGHTVESVWKKAPQMFWWISIALACVCSFM